MFNKLFKLFAILSVMGVIAFGVGCKSYDSDIEGLQQQINDLKGTTATDMKSTIEKIEQLAAAQSALSAQAEALSKELSDQKAQTEQKLSALENSYNALNSDLSSLQSDLNTTKGTLATVQKDLASLQSSAATKSELDSVKSQLEKALTDGLSDLEKKIDEIKDGLKNYYTKEEIDAFVGDIDEKIEGIEEQLKTLASADDLNTLKSTVDALAQTVEKLTGDLTAADEKLAAECAKLAGQIEELEERLAVAEASLAEWQDFADFWFGTEENGWNGYMKDLENFINSHGSTDADIEAAFNALIERIEALEADNEFIFGTEENGWSGWYQDIQNWRQDLNQLDGEFLETLVNTLDNLAMTVGDLEAALDGIEGTVAEYVESYVAGEIAKIFTTDPYKSFYENYEKLQEVLVGKEADWEARIAWLEAHGGEGTTYADIIEKLYGDVESLKATQQEFNELKANLAATIQSEIDKALAQGGSIEAAISAAIAGVSSDLSALEQRVADLETSVEDHEKKIGALIGRIQSLVFVPTHEDMKMHIGTQYIQYSNVKVELTDAYSTVTYRVSPKTLAEDLAASADWCFYAEEVTRADAASLEIVEGSIKGSNATGLITFDVTTDYVFPADKTLAVALCVSTETEGVATEYTSNYTPVSSAGENIISKFIFAEKDEEGVYTAYDAAAHKHEARYNQDLGVEYPLFENCEVVFDNGSELISLEEASKNWKAEIVWATETAGRYPNSGLVADSYTYEDGVFTLTEAKEDNIGKTFTDGVIAYVYEKNSNGKIYIGSTSNPYTDAVAITKDVRAIKGEATIVWDYDTWTGNHTYTVNVALLDAETGEPITDLTAAQLAEYAATWDLSEAAISDELKTFAKLELSSAVPAEEGEDGQSLDITIKNIAYYEGATGLLEEAIAVSKKFNEENSVSDTEISLVFNFEAPASRGIDIDLTIDAIEVEKEFFAYFAYSGDLTYESLKPYQNSNFYSAEEIEKFFGGNAANALTLVRKGVDDSRTGYKFKAAMTTDADVVATAEVRGYNAGRADKWKANYRAAAGQEQIKTDLNSANVAAFSVTFSNEFDFNNVESAEFTSAAGAVVTVTNGPTYPVSAKVTVVNPTTDEGWIKGDRLSGATYGIQNTFRSSYGTGDAWANFVNIRGSHEAGTHNYGFESAKLWDALKWADMEKYTVTFELNDDATAVGDAPAVDDESMVTLTDLTYHNETGNRNYNTVAYDAVVTDKSGKITYRHFYNDHNDYVKLFIELPFDDPTIDDEERVITVPERQSVTKQLGEFITEMKNYAGDDNIFLENGTINTDLAAATCYGLEIKWNKDFTATTDDATIKLNAQLAEDGTFTIAANDATLQHPFEVTAEFTITGNFGYEYTGQVTFTVK